MLGSCLYDTEWRLKYYSYSCIKKVRILVSKTGGRRFNWMWGWGRPTLRYAVAEHSTYFGNSTLHTSTFAILFIVHASVNTTMYSVNVIIQFLHHTWWQMRWSQLLCSQLPTFMYVVDVSHLIRYARACSKYEHCLKPMLAADQWTISIQTYRFLNSNIRYQRLKLFKKILVKQ